MTPPPAATCALDALRSHASTTPLAVIGDLMVDRYLTGEVERISAEAPIPVVHIESTREVAGGAANVAVTLARLGFPVRLVGLTGDDEARQCLLDIAASHAMDTRGVVADASRPTTLKTRVLGRRQQMLRLDREATRPPGPRVAEALADAVTEAILHSRALVLSDYRKGTLAGEICGHAIQVARAQRVPVVVDPKGTDYGCYAGADVLTPNLAEVALATGTTASAPAVVLAAADALRRRLGVGAFVVTRGADGATVLQDEGRLDLSVRPREVYDVSGAGDAVTAVIAGVLACGLPLLAAVPLANVAGGVVVEKLGTVSVSLPELIASVASSQPFADRLDAVAEIANAWHAGGERVAIVEGTFDPLRACDVAALNHAGADADRVVVVIQDEGPPEVLHARAQVLSALHIVDAVAIGSAALKAGLVPEMAHFSALAPLLP